MEPVVFLPGMMCDARLFAPQLDSLSRERAVMVAPICIGDRIEEIASNVLTAAPAKFALCGLSMGGIVAMEVIRRAPDRVTRIALLDTNPLSETPERAAAREPQMVRVKAGRLAEVMRDEMKPQYLAQGPHRHAVLDLCMDMAVTLGPEVFLRQSRALQRRRDQQSTLRKIKCPALVMCGEHDTLCTPDRHHFMAELIPYATFKVVGSAGHLPPLEQPQVTTDLLRDWLRQPFVLQ
ncbi:MAG: alpha/beta fold hydrolase [Pseudomonadota bacterium]